MSVKTLYSGIWSATTPGCLILLLDRSGSMNEVFGGKSDAAGATLKDQVAKIVNSTINKLADASRKGVEIRPRVEVAIIGYGGASVVSALPVSFAGRDTVKIDELFNNPVRVEKKTRQVYHKEFGETEAVEEDFRIWIEPDGNGGTPMCAALRKAAAIAGDWTASHRGDHFPPVVINITDGEATDGDPRGPAHELTSIGNDDGPVLLFNCHISKAASDEVLYPDATFARPNDNFVETLFAMSSPLPDAMLNLAKQKINPNMKPGAKGFVFNGDASDIVNMITIATVATINPDR